MCLYDLHEQMRPTVKRTEMTGHLYIILFDLTNAYHVLLGQIVKLILFQT